MCEFLLKRTTTQELGRHAFLLSRLQPINREGRCSTTFYPTVDRIISRKTPRKRLIQDFDQRRLGSGSWTGSQMLVSSIGFFSGRKI